MNNKQTKRRAALISAALHLAATEGFAAVIQRRLAQACDISGPAVQYHVGCMDDFRREVFAAALDAYDLAVIGHAVAAGYLVSEPLRSEGLRAAFGGGNNEQ